MSLTQREIHTAPIIVIIIKKKSSDQELIRSDLTLKNDFVGAFEAA